MPAISALRFPVLRHVLLLSAIFAAIGVTQPFLPAFLAARGLSPGEIALALALGSLARLLAGPAAGRWADALGDARLLLGGLALLGLLVAGGFLAAAGLLGFILVQVLLGIAMAPQVPWPTRSASPPPARGCSTTGRSAPPARWPSWRRRCWPAGWWGCGAMAPCRC
ncbi:MFS transporter [Teichococcus aestuarii]|uniref:MFS transporter n=1 Tax=Teichococcus aestuarii TaxID=568898 RepID=UPI003623F9AC